MEKLRWVVLRSISLKKKADTIVHLVIIKVMTHKMFPGQLQFLATQSQKMSMKVKVSLCWDQLLLKNALGT
uniref:Uncharacterized protein n=1 Tax=Arundo donax TaxID=35708 RepID=A0A0A9EAV0_ARUDO